MVSSFERKTFMSNGVYQAVYLLSIHIFYENGDNKYGSISAVKLSYCRNAIDFSNWKSI